ncbi:MAG: response regulator [Gammaproteobacteria bacterium]|nr:hypothetical protein [Gammaproteobacteria bacterium]
MKVLIVAEELLIAMSLAAELELAGHQVLGPCASADEALRSLDGRHVDLALIDAALHAPLSGSELATMLHAECDIPTLLLTRDPAAAYTHVIGALGAITLPFDPADISASIEAAAVVLRGGKPISPPGSLQLF